MGKVLGVLASILVVGGCASSRSERQPPSSATLPAAPSTSAPPSTSTSPDAAIDQAAAGLASAQARVQEAQRELDTARSNSSAADAEARNAQAQLDSARRATDSVAQARATEQAWAAETRRRSAMAHLDYAQKLVAARQADVDVAQLHQQTVEAGGGTAAPAGGQADQRLIAAQNAEGAARQRAAALGREALAAQRTWEDLSRSARAATGGSAASGGMGTGSGSPRSGDTDPGSVPQSSTAPVPSPR